MENPSDPPSTAVAGETQGKNALKRELKNSQKEEERKRTEEEKAKKKYLENRLKHLATEKAEGRNPSPQRFFVTMSIEEYIKEYGGLRDGQRLGDVPVSLAGRIMLKRASGAKLVFYDLHDGGFKVQVMADASKSDLTEAEFSKLHANVKRGDFVGITGFPGKSKKGELNIFPWTFVVLSYCLHMMPKPKSAACAANGAYLKKNPWLPCTAKNPETYILKDQLGEHFLEGTCVNPTFIISYCYG